MGEFFGIAIFITKSTNSLFLTLLTIEYNQRCLLEKYYDLIPQGNCTESGTISSFHYCDSWSWCIRYFSMDNNNSNKPLPNLFEGR
jgi:hypothetical protein